MTDSQSALEKKLASAAEGSSPADIERILGRLQRAIEQETREDTREDIRLAQNQIATIINAAKTAAGIAFRSGRWDNLAYLADFLHDVDSLDAQSDSESEIGDPSVITDDVSGGGGKCKLVPRPDQSCVLPTSVYEAVLGDCFMQATGIPLDDDSIKNITAAESGKFRDCAAKQIVDYAARTHIMQFEAATQQAATQQAATQHSETDVDGGASSCPCDIASAMVDANYVSFSVVDPDSKDDYRSATNPSPYISLVEPEDDLSFLEDADEIVISEPSIKVVYKYPFGSVGPTDLEQKRRGWIFEEKSADGIGFTRAELARTISARYHEIYAEEDETSSVKATYLPGTFDRAATRGKYAIWGHILADLDLHAVIYDPEDDVYSLGIEVS
jgi:hypothetical protein